MYALPDESEGSLPEQVVEDKEFQKTMQDMLDSLPAQQRSAMMLYYYEKLSVKQIAEVFETSEGTIKSRLNYGRKAMKDKVEEYEKKNGVRLHSSLLPLLLLWLFGLKKESIPKAALPLWAASTAGVAATGASAAAVSTGAAATGLGVKITAAVLAVVVTAGAVAGGVTLLDGGSDEESDRMGYTTAATQGTETLPATPSQSGGEETTAPSEPEPTMPSEPEDEVPPVEDQPTEPTTQPPDQEEDAPTEPTEDVGVVTPPVQEPDQGEDLPTEPDVEEPPGETETYSEGLSFEKVDGGYTVSGIGTCTDERVIIPPTYMGEPVIGIKEAAFGGSKIKHVTVPDGVTNLFRAFNGCYDLVSATLPEGVTSMFYTFAGCSALADVNLPSTVTNIQGAFAGCSSLTYFEVPEGITSLYYAFENCTSLKTVKVADSVTDMFAAFQGCTSLENVTIPEGVTTIASCFSDCTSLKEITIPNSVVYAANAFRECKALTEVTFQPGFCGELYRTFEGCTSLTKVDVSEGVKDLRYAFRYCTSLTEATIPVSTTAMGDIFVNCTALTDVYYAGTMEQWTALEGKGECGATCAYVVHCTDGDIHKNEA